MFNQGRFWEMLLVPTQAPNPESADPRGQIDGLQRAFVILHKTECVCEREKEGRELVWFSGNMYFIDLIKFSVGSVTCSKKYNRIGLDCMFSFGGF